MPRMAELLDATPLRPVPLDVSCVVGIDVSLTSTGVARISAEGCVAGLVKTTGTLSDDLETTVARVSTITAQVRDWLVPGALAVVEGPSYDSAVGGKTWDRAGLWHRLVADAMDTGCPVAVVAPGTLKKYAAGHGHADKARVRIGLRRLLPDYEFTSSDDADAAVLGLMGAQRIGLRAQSKERLAMLDAVAWPRGIAAFTDPAPAPKTLAGAVA